ncbi:hypothetical protein FBUS_05739, partial [Fasciolopsis buskii]
ASITSQWFGCFPGSAEVHLGNGTSTRIDHLRVGDYVLGRSTVTGEMEPTPIVAFLHRDRHAWSPMLHVIYTIPGVAEKRRSLFLTPDHLVYVKNDNNEVQRLRAVFASHLGRGDIIMVSSSYANKSLTEGIVLATEYATSFTEAGDFAMDLAGLYAPLTRSGSMIVNDVVVSCFAHFSDPDLSYFATWPIQWMHRLNRWIKVSESPNDLQDGVHWLADFLLNWLTPVLPRTMFYSQT